LGRRAGRLFSFSVLGPPRGQLAFAHRWIAMPLMMLVVPQVEALWRAALEDGTGPVGEGYGTVAGLCTGWPS